MTEALKFRLRHTMLPVADLDRSVDFYTRLLGMTVVRERRDSPTPTAYVGYGDEASYPALELISGTEHAGAKWHGHINIAVSDLPALCARLQAAGVTFARPHREANGRIRFAYALDPDGFEVELVEGAQ
ncbi:MAG: VOC family protein [Gemmatimonas sp.]